MVPILTILLAFLNLFCHTACYYVYTLLIYIKSIQ